MSVAGTKNFDQPPHDSNRTHLGFSTSGLLLGSRAPLVWGNVSWTKHTMENDSDRRLYIWQPSTLHTFFASPAFLALDSWPKKGWNPIKRNNKSANDKHDFQIEDIPKWFFWGVSLSKFLKNLKWDLLNNMQPFSIPPKSKPVHLLVITSVLAFGLLAKKGLKPDKWDNKSANDTHDFQIEDIPTWFFFGVHPNF